LRVTGAKTDRDLLVKIIKNPEVQFKVEPQNTLGLGEFLHRVGAIKNKPAAVKDYFFDDPRTASGS
jgi:NitT/TauT family transport system substrate-binding protein